MPWLAFRVAVSCWSKRLRATSRILRHSASSISKGLGSVPAYTPGIPQGHMVTPDEAYAISRLGALEALLFGSTLINDTFVHADIITPAMAEVGLRIWSCGRIHDVDFSGVSTGRWEHKDGIGDATLGGSLDAG